ncbi:MAG: PEP-utilizing enzyme [Acidimicrobiales bacterium]
MVTEHGSHACHAAIIAQEKGSPAVVGSPDTDQYRRPAS